MLHRRPDLTYPLHHMANGLPYAAFVDDKFVRERGLCMVSHSDLLPYSDEKAMKMLSTQWKYHDPAGTYWTTAEECYTLMAVGHVHRNVPATTTNESDDPTHRNTQDSSNVDRAAPAIYDDLHNCVGWPPSDSSSSTVFDSSACYTMRSMCHERNVHSFPSEVRVLSKPSLKTVDSLFFTGEMDKVDRFDPTIMRSSRTSNNREQAAPKTRSQKRVFR